MRYREWWQKDEQVEGGAGGGAGANDPLDEARQRGQQLMARASEALRKAGSEESELFLEAVRQEGGQ